MCIVNPDAGELRIPCRHRLTLLIFMHSEAWSPPVSAGRRKHEADRSSSPALTVIMGNERDEHSLESKPDALSSDGWIGELTSAAGGAALVGVQLQHRHRTQLLGLVRELPLMASLCTVSLPHPS